MSNFRAGSWEHPSNGSWRAGSPVYAQLSDEPIIVSAGNYTHGQPCDLLIANIGEGAYSILWSPTENPAHPDAVELTVTEDNLTDGAGIATVTAARGVVRYGTVGFLYVSQGEAFSNGLAALLLLEDGKSAVVLTAPLADPDDRITAIPDLAPGDQLIWFGVVGGTIDDVIVAQDGSWVAEEGVTQFSVEAHIAGVGYVDSAVQYTGEGVEGSDGVTTLAGVVSVSTSGSPAKFGTATVQGVGRVIARRLQPLVGDEWIPDGPTDIAVDRSVWRVPL